MPRVGRLHIEGGLYHVMGRGLERRWVFGEDEDKEWFLTRFGDCLNKIGAQCFAWALMSNHYHFLIRVGSAPLTTMMRSLLGSYGTYYNRRHSRVGYVFQNRFKSILCDEDEYMLALARYIHLNPLRAKMLSGMDALDKYLWAGHSGMLGYQKRDWHSVDEVLRVFSRDKNAALSLYQAFMAEKQEPLADVKLCGGGLVRSHGGWEEITKLKQRNIQCIGDERILGSDEFVATVIKQDVLKLARTTERHRQGWDLKMLADKVCEVIGVDVAELSGKARSNRLSDAKAMICYLAKEAMGLSLTAIAEFMKISQPAVSKWVNKGKVLDASGEMADDILG